MVVRAIFKYITTKENGILFWKEELTESGLKGFDEPHDERGAFRDVLQHLGHFVVSATHQTGLIDTLDVVTDLMLKRKKTFRHVECEWKKCLIYLLGKVSVFFYWELGHYVSEWMANWQISEVDNLSPVDSTTAKHSCMPRQTAVLAERYS